MRSTNFLLNIQSVTSPPIAGTEFSVAHSMVNPTTGQPVIPVGYFVTRRSKAALIYESNLSAGLGLGTNFIGGWEFENAGNLGLDSSTNALNLTNNNVVTQAAGKVGSASSYVRASTQYLSRASEALLQAGDISFTLAAWVKLASKPAGSFMMIVSKTNAGANEFYLAYATAADRFQAAVFRPAGVTVNSNTFGAPATGTFYFVLMWHDSAADTLNIQVNNGGVDSQATGGALAAAGAAEFRIGGWQNSALYWDGQIDQVMFWKRVLTPAERTSLYNGGNGVTVATAIGPVVAVATPWTDTLAFFRSDTGSCLFNLAFFA